VFNRELGEEIRRTKAPDLQVLISRLGFHDELVYREFIQFLHVYMTDTAILIWDVQAEHTLNNEYLIMWIFYIVGI